MTQRRQGRWSSSIGSSSSACGVGLLVLALFALAIAGCGRPPPPTAKRPASPAPAIPASTPPTRATPKSDDRQLQRRQPRGRLDRADPRHQQLRQLRLDPGDRQGRDLLAGPRLQRAGAQPRLRRSALDGDLRTARRGPERHRRRRRPGLSARLRPKPSRSTRKRGEQLWSVKLTRNEHEGIDMAPGYQDGHRLRLDRAAQRERDLRRRRRRHPLGARREDRQETVALRHRAEQASGASPNVNSGGGVWYPPAFDGKGSMYFGVGNPAPFPGTGKYPWGSSRPGPNLYTDSLVKLNAKTGKLDWYHQVTPHDLYDWDFQGPPILIEGRRQGNRRRGGQVGHRPRGRPEDRQGAVAARGRQAQRPRRRRPAGDARRRVEDQDRGPSTRAHSAA